MFNLKIYSNRVTEIGASNFFLFWKNQIGEDELVTPPANELVLHGVTRDSILKMARDMNKFRVSEKEIYITDLINAIKEKRVYEIFSTGTAAVIAPIDTLGYLGKNYKVPIDPELNAGKLAYEFSQKLFKIMYGIEEHPWSEICE